MEDNKARSTGKPLQRISWSQKMKNKQQWFKDTAEYYISNSRFHGSNSHNRGGRNLQMLYDVYNNKFPPSWFSHFTNPLSSSEAQHRKLPAKIRPTTILRANIDLLFGEYPNRPFAYQVENLGEEGYNEFIEERNNRINGNLSNHFYHQFLLEMEAKGQPIEEAPDPSSIPLPDQVERDTLSSFKDKYAVKGQKWMTRARREYGIDETRFKMFKDWGIVGEAYSYKGFRGGIFKYERVSPLRIDYDKSEDEDYIEDGEWAVRRRDMVLSQVVDDYYQSLKPKDIDGLENAGIYSSPGSFYEWIGNQTDATHIPVYHVQWKGLKEILYVSGVDEMGQPYEDIQDEDYVLADGESITKREWVNEVYEATRIWDDIWVDMQAVQVQRNAMNNFSYCKLNYNGKKYSDTHSVNISPLEMGIPFQIMFIIVNYVKEKMLAKSKGNVVLFDKNAIPTGKGWSEEKFFYYLEAMNVGLLSRYQPGVDRSWNQYTTLNMSQLGEVAQLTVLEDSIIQQWDATLGINRQRKGATYSSDGQGVNERAVFQSSVITDMIFAGFEQLIAKDLQGILDFGRFINADGLRALYNGDITGTELLEIMPEDFQMAELGIFMSRGRELQDTLNALKQNVQAMLQNNIPPSTIIDIYTTQNLAELKQILKQTEVIMQKNQEKAAEQQQKHELNIENLRKELLTFEADLQERKLNAEWDRKDQNTVLKIDTEAQVATGEEVDPWAAIDGEEEKNQIAREKIASDERRTYQTLQTQKQIADEGNATKIKVAAMKPKPVSKS